MSDNPDNPDYIISTPENIDLHLELAGLGNRALAVMVDCAISFTTIAFLLIISITLISFFEAMVHLNKELKSTIEFYFIAALILLLFSIVVGYFIFFETRWKGQTPGKRMLNIRVIDANGQPASFGAICIRNLIRILEQNIFPIAMVVAFIDKNERRLGDLAGGTLVIKERLPEFTNALLNNARIVPNEAAAIDIGKISPEEYQLLLDFLKRREIMAEASRQELAKDLAKHMAQKLSIADYGSDEPFLETLYAAYIGAQKAE